jgi:hypothetical protein
MLVDEKTDLLEQCATFGTELVFTHDPTVAASRVLRDDRGRFSASEPVPALTRWNLDAPEQALAG